MAIAGIPEVINDFNIYRTGNRLAGMTGEVAIPDFEAITATISGNGILGEYDAPVTGHYGNMDQEIPFRVLNMDFFDLADPTVTQELTLRGAIQYMDRATQNSAEMGMRVVFRGRCKKFAPGTVKQREAMNGAITLALTYILIELDGKEKVKLDKINGEFRINGVDKLAKIRQLT